MHSVRYLFVHDDASQPTEWGNLKSPGRDFVLNVQDPNKAVISLSYELYTYLVCTKLLSHRLGAGYPAAKARLDKGEVASNFTEAESKALHDVFNDVTAIMEFSLNKLTAYAEDSISDIMRFVRFSAAYYLGIDRNPNSVHTSGKTLNTAFFSSSQLRAIPSIRYGNEWASGIEEPISVPAVIKRYTASAKGEKNDPSDYFSVIRDTVEMNLQSPTLYVDVDDAPFLEGICWNSIQKSQVPCSHHVVPLMALARAIADACRQEEILIETSVSDLEEFCRDILVAKNALLGFIETRDTVLNSSAVSASSVAKSYSDNAGRKALAECMLYGRILHCIFAGSTMEENGRKMWIYPKFTVSSMLRMMDPEIFGCRVYLPNMIFVTDTDRSMRLYDRYLNDLGFDSVPAHHGKSYQKVIDDLERYEVSWRPSGRVKNVRIYGCFGHMRSVSRIPPDEFCSSSIGKYRHGTVFVCDESRKAEIIRAVRYGVRAEGLRNRIWRIVVILDPDLKGSRTYSSLDVTDGNIMEIGLSNLRQLFDTHSNGIAVRTRSALDRIMASLCAKYGVEFGDMGFVWKLVRKLSGSSSLVTEVEREFVDYYCCMSDEMRLFRTIPKSPGLTKM